MKYKLLPLLLLLALSSGSGAEWNLRGGSLVVEGTDGNTASEASSSELVYEGALRDRKKDHVKEEDKEKEQTKKKTLIKKKEHKDNVRTLQDETPVKQKTETKDRKRDRIHQDAPTKEDAPAQKKKAWLRKKEKIGNEMILGEIYNI